MLSNEPCEMKRESQLDQQLVQKRMGETSLITSTHTSSVARSDFSVREVDINPHAYR